MPRRRGVWAVVLIALLAFVSCRSKTTAAPAPSPARPLPTAPAGLLAELTVGEPRAFYAALRSLRPENAAYPEDPALALALVWGLPLAAAEQLDLDQPLHGVLVSTYGQHVRLVSGCHLRSGTEFVRLMTSQPGRRALPETLSGLVVVSGGSGQPLAVLGDWLLVSTEEEAIRDAGPYVARALPLKPAAPELLAVDIAQVALRGPLDELLRARWNATHEALAKAAQQARTSAGRPADFADPDAVLAKVDEKVRGLLDFLRASQSARVTGTLSAERLELVLDVLPSAGGSAATMLQTLNSIPLTPLLTLPRDTAFGALFQLTTADLPASKAGGVMGALGRVLEATEPATLAALSGEKSLVVRRTLRDRTATERALVELARAATGRAPQRAGPDGAELVRLTLGGNEPPRELWWLTNQGALVLGADCCARKDDGERPALRDFTTAPEAERLAAEPSLVALIARHEAASFALIANFGASARKMPGYVGWGRHGERARLELEVAPATLPAITKLMAL